MAQPASFSMRKEVLIAIIIGFGLGLVITFGIWTANQALKKPTAEKAPLTQEKTTPASTTELSLSLSSPENNSISSEETIEVSGKTNPRVVVVILYPEGEKILEADENGSFSTEISLTGGENEISISAYDKEGNEIKKNLTVVYSTAEI